MAQVPFVYEQESSPEIGEIYNKMISRGATVFNAHRVLAHNSSLLRNYMRLGNSLFNKTEIPPPLRELAILFVAELTDCEYTWAIHYPMALEVGLNQEQIDTMSQWRHATTYSSAERAILGYVEAIICNYAEQSQIDKIFTELKKHFSDKFIVELTLLIGYYQMSVSFTHTLGIEIESESIMTLKHLLGNENPGCIDK